MQAGIEVRRGLIPHLLSLLTAAKGGGELSLALFSPLEVCLGDYCKRGAFYLALFPPPQHAPTRIVYRR